MAKKKKPVRKTRVAKKPRPPVEMQDPRAVQRQLTEFDPTQGYRSRPWFKQFQNIIEDLPWFRLWHATMMIGDPIVRQAINARDAMIRALEVKVESDNPALKEYIENQWKRIWRHSRKLLKTKRSGYGGFQVEFDTESKTGRTIIVGLKKFAARDVRPAIQAGKVVGIYLHSSRGGGRGLPSGPILNPRGLWTTFDAEDGLNYGWSILRRSFSPWWEKWMDHGSKKVQQQRMIKDAYRADIFWVAMHRKITLPDGTELSWADILREAGEAMMSGSTAVLPLMRDGDGNEDVRYDPPQDTGNPSAIYTWGDNLDRDIRAGLDLPEEVIQAATTGSGFSGRSIPFSVFLGACTDEAEELLAAIDEQVLRPLAWLAFGGRPEYTIDAVDLIDTFAEAVQSSQMGGQALGGEQGQPENGQPQPQSQFEAFKGPRGGTGARNTETGAIISGQRGQELLARR